MNSDRSTMSLILRWAAFSVAFLVLPLQAASKKKPVVPKVVPNMAAMANDPLRMPLFSSATAHGGSVLRLQILLDRLHYSSGEIDGRYGSLARAAVVAFQQANALEGAGSVTAATWQLLNHDAAPAMVSYTITAEDVAGPFVPIPTESAEKAKLPALGYVSAVEGLGEKFHASPALLRLLNPGIPLDRAGSVISVPNVTRTPLEKAPGMTVRVSKANRTVEAIDAAGKIMARYPATIGSEHDPLPIGKWKINGVARNPSFNYNPDLFWDAEASEKKAKIPAGPNNPVGVVWIDLSKPHYGIHGTPEPSTIGKTSSHGCIRLTNWDAMELSQLVSPGVPALLEE
ncbi:MAG: L,D-transpeptidase [Thermoanaerobaculia bacterium]